MRKPTKIIAPLIGAALLTPNLLPIATANENTTPYNYYIQHVMQDVKNEQGEVIGHTRAVPVLYTDGEFATGGSNYFDEATGLYQHDGIVKEILNTQNGKMILVEGEGLYPEIKLTIHEKTEIVAADGTLLSADDITTDTRVTAYYGPAMTKSIPPITQAHKVIILNETIENKDLKTVGIKINGNAVTFSGAKLLLVISEGKAIVPASFAADQLGAAVNWDENSNIVTVQSGEKSFQIKMSSFTEANTGKIIDGIPCLPLRFVAETLGYQVDWDQKTHTVILEK